MARVILKGLDYLTVGMGWSLDDRYKTGKLWRIKHGFPFQILVDKFGYEVVRDENYASFVLHNPKDGTFVVIGSTAQDAPMSGSFLCDKVRAKAYGLHLLLDK